MPDEFPEFTSRQRIDASGGFVQDQDIGIMNQRATQAELLLHASRELSCRPMGEGVQTGPLQEVSNPPLAFASAVAEQSTKKVDVLEHGKRGIEIFPQALGHVGDAWSDSPAVPGVAHVPIEDFDLSGLDRSRTGNQRQETGFPHAIGTDQPDENPRPHFNVHGIQCHRLAIPQHDVPHAHHRLRIDGDRIRAKRLGAHGAGILICNQSGQGAFSSSRT